jgi:hypothetical protein
MKVWNKNTRTMIAEVNGDVIPNEYQSAEYVATSDMPGRFEMLLKGLLDLDEWEYIKDGRLMNWSRDEMIILKGHTELLEDGEQVIDGRVVNVREQLTAELAELKNWLADHDYIGTKIATGRATKEEYADIIAEMNVKADRIDEINKQLYS